MKSHFFKILLLASLGYATNGVAQDSQSQHSHREQKGLPGAHQPAESASPGTYQGTHDHRKQKGLSGKGLPSDQAEQGSEDTLTSDSADSSADGSLGAAQHDHRKMKGLAGSSLPEKGEAENPVPDSGAKKIHDHKKMHK